MNNLSFDELLNLVLKWNIDFPIDRWWRKTHSVAFNSTRHREITFIDMFIEWYEDSLYEELLEEPYKYEPGKGDYLKQRKAESVLSEETFNNIDLDSI